MSNLKTAKVVAIRKGTRKRVYDIGVEKNHNFFANGLLVSNCFQEQFMNLAIELSGFTPGESDQMRKTLVKKSLDTLDKKSGEKAMLREKFVKGAKELHNIDEKISNALFDKIEFFSLYGFNKSLHEDTLIPVYTRQGRKSSIKFEGVKKLKDVKSSYLVKSYDESSGKDIFVEVKNLHDHGEINLVEVSLDSGEKIRCTMDHKFRTRETREMIPLWEIQKRGLSIVVDA